jgi:hypothetical protein
MSTRCAFCNKFFNDDKALFEHIDKIHFNNPIVRYVQNKARAKTRRRIILRRPVKEEPSPLIDELLKKIRLLEASLHELEARPSGVKYVYKPDIPTVPWGYDADKKMAEAMFWDGHNPSFDGDKPVIQGYTTNHAEIMAELKEKFKTKKKRKRKKKG